jgi:transcriptional regulator with XRE-family HTH domain
MTERGAARQRQRLRRELRALRDARGLTQAEAAAAVGWSESKVNRIEAGVVAVTPTDVHALLAAYGGADDDTTAALVAAARESRRQPWSRFRDLHSPAFLRYLGHEGFATTLDEFAPLFVPGLLQTPDYSRALLATVATPPLPDDVAERVLESRAMRQELLDDAACPEIHVVLDEVVVRRQVGGREVMAGQLRRLCDLAGHPRLTLQVMPMSAGAYTGMQSGFILLGFADDPPLAYLEGSAGGPATRPAGGRHGVVGGGEDADGTEPYRRAFTGMREKALSPSASRSLVARLVAEASRDT